MWKTWVFAVWVTVSLKQILIFPHFQHLYFLGHVLAQALYNIKNFPRAKCGYQYKHTERRKLIEQMQEKHPEWDLKYFNL